MRRQLLPAVRMLAILSVILGVAYPLVVTAIAQVALPSQANGSLIFDDDGNPIGSALIGQAFDGAEWFHGRPSAADYDGTASGSTNLGPNNPELLAAVAARVDAFRVENGLAPDEHVPVDAVTSSGSGLDPHISIANARLQAPRVAEARGRSLTEVLALIDDNTDQRSLGFLGEPGVNVVELNAAVVVSADG